MLNSYFLTCEKFGVQLKFERYMQCLMLDAQDDGKVKGWSPKNFHTPVGCVFIIEVSHQVFGSVVLVSCCSKAFCKVHLLKRLLVNFELV